MSEHLSTEQMRRYHDRALPLVELLGLSEHLACCALCHVRYGELYRLPGTHTPVAVDLSELADDEPLHLLLEDEIVPYVEGHLDDTGREIVESHMGLCAQCRMDVEGLLKFKSELESSMASELSTFSAAPAQNRVVPRWRWSLEKVAAVLVAVALLISVVMLRGRFTGEQSGIARHETAGATPGEQSADVPADVQPDPTQNQPDIQAIPPSEVVIELRDGGRRITLDKQNDLEGFEALPLSSQRTIRAALIAGVVKKPEVLSELSEESGILRGEPVSQESFAPLSPAGTVVLDDRPTFRWRALSGATAYSVSVFDADFNLMAKSELLKSTEWKAPRALRRGAVYSWQVSALIDDAEVTSPVEPAPDVRFKVIEKAKAAEIERIRRMYPNSHLALGVFYAQSGLGADAEREFRALVRANPRATVARNLLRSVRAWHKP